MNPDAKMNDSAQLISAWDDYSNRRRWFFGVWLGGFLLLGLLMQLVGGAVFPLAILWVLAFLVAAWRLSAFRCPRCGRFFFLTWLYGNLLAQRCLHCGLPKWNTTAVLRSPKDAEGFTHRASTYLNQRDFDKAIADCSEAIRLNPKLAEAYSIRGYAYSEKGEFDKAITDYNEAIRLNRHDARTYGNRGRAYYNKGELDKAIADYSEAIRLNPKDAKAYWGRGLAYQSDLDKAILDFTEALRLDPNFGESYFGRGLAYSKKGEEAKAEEDFVRAKELGYLE